MTKSEEISDIVKYSLPHCKIVEFNSRACTLVLTMYVGLLFCLELAMYFHNYLNVTGFA